MRIMASAVRGQQVLDRRAEVRRGACRAARTDRTGRSRCAGDARDALRTRCAGGAVDTVGAVRAVGPVGPLRTLWPCRTLRAGRAEARRRERDGVRDGRALRVDRDHAGAVRRLRRQPGDRLAVGLDDRRAAADRHRGIACRDAVRERPRRRAVEAPLVEVLRRQAVGVDLAAQIGDRRGRESRQRRGRRRTERRRAVGDPQADVVEEDPRREQRGRRDARRELALDLDAVRAALLDDPGQVRVQAPVEAGGAVGAAGSDGGRRGFRRGRTGSRYPCR